MTARVGSIARFRAALEATPVAQPVRRAANRAVSRSGYRRPSYGAAMRVAKLVLVLVDRPQGIKFTEAKDLLGISERTLVRYIAACTRAAGAPVLVRDCGRLVLTKAAIGWVRSDIGASAIDRVKA